jgi:uncharacterized delta-60 repeat protein
VHRIFIFLLTVLFFNFPSASAQFFQAGELDTTFNFGEPHPILANNGPLPGTGANNVVYAMDQYVDGKLVFGGNFTTYNGRLVNRIARLHADGRLDSTFNPGAGANSTIRAVCVQADGKVIIAGQFSLFNGTPRNSIARLNVDGSLDTTFNPGTGANNTILAMSLQANGQLIIGGFFNAYNGRNCGSITRLNADGSLDTTFNSGTVGTSNSVRALDIQADGKIIIVGNFTSYNNTPRNRVARLNTDGGLDSSFNPGSGANQWVTSLAIQPDGRILIGGSFSTYNGTTRNGIARLHTNGSLDTTFSPGTGTDGELFTMVVQSNGKVLLGGLFITYNGTSQRRIARINADGSLDTTFRNGTAANNSVEVILLQPNGKLFIGGFFTDYNDKERRRLTRLNADGSYDLDFNPITGANNTIHNLGLQNNGKLMIIGEFNRFNTIARNQIARLNADGSLDTTFLPGTITNGIIRAVVTQPNGQMIIVGTFTTYNGVARGRIARLNVDGSLDMTFNSGVGANSIIRDLVLQPDGKVIIVGFFTTYDGIARSRIARLNTDGSLDMSFNPGTGADGLVNAVVLQPDGKMVIVGNFINFNGLPRNTIARLNADGSLDTTFVPGTGANFELLTAALQPDGKVLIGGWFTIYNGVLRDRIARIHVDGSLDLTFNPPAGVNSYVISLALQNNGQIMVGGDFSTFGGIPRAYIVRLNTNGSMDTTFNMPTGPNDGVRAIVLTTDGKAVVGGVFNTYNGLYRSRIARIFAPDCISSITNTTDSNAICAGATKNLTGTVGGSWVIASGPGSIIGNTYTASGGGGPVSVYNRVGACYSPLVTFMVDYPEIPAIPANITACIGATVTITPTSGGSSYRFYADSTTNTPLPGGDSVISFTTPVLSLNTTYYVSSLSIAGCESPARTAVTVNIIPLPVVNIVRLGDTLAADTATGSYQWFKDGLTIAGANSRTYLPNASGLYRVSLTSPEGCVGLSNELNVIIASLDGEFSAGIRWNSYPVPFQEELTIEAEAAFSYQLIDARGVLLLSGITQDKRISLPTQGLASGMYFLKININGQTAVRKVIRK